MVSGPVWYWFQGGGSGSWTRPETQRTQQIGFATDPTSTVFIYLPTYQTIAYAGTSAYVDLSQLNLEKGLFPDLAAMSFQQDAFPQPHASPESRFLSNFGTMYFQNYMPHLHVVPDLHASSTI
jgi:hypothetical protein